jgi:hypothetical protein
MLPPFIIEQIRQREERERAQREENRPRVELPLEPGGRGERGPKRRGASFDDEDEPNRGLVVVDLGS